MVSNPSSCPRALRHSNSFSMTWNKATALRRQLDVGLARLDREDERKDIPLNGNIAVSDGEQENLNLLGVCRQRKEHGQDIINSYRTS